MEKLNRLYDLLEKTPELADILTGEVKRLAASRVFTGPKEALSWAFRTVLGIELSDLEMDQFMQASRDLSPDEMAMVSGGIVLSYEAEAALAQFKATALLVLKSLPVFNIFS